MAIIVLYYSDDVIADSDIVCDAQGNCSRDLPSTNPAPPPQSVPIVRPQNTNPSRVIIPQQNPPIFRPPQQQSGFTFQCYTQVGICNFIHASQQLPAGTSCFCGDAFGNNWIGTVN